MPEEKIKEWEKWSVLLHGSTGLPNFGTWNLMSVALSPPLDTMFPVGKTRSLSFCPALSVEHMLNAQ